MPDSIHRSEDPHTLHQQDEQAKEIAPFLRSLRRMLDRESDAILCWTKDGKAFEIHDMEVMTSYILPKYFKHAKYTSFQRQLNYFNFRKWTKSRATVCTFSNAFFVRDQPDLTWRITRKRGLSESKSPGSPGNGSASPRSPKSPKLVAKTTVKTTTTKTASIKKEPSLSRKTATSTTPSRSALMNQKKAVKVTKPVAVKVEAAGQQTPTEVESLEWVDTLYPSLEALEAECSDASAYSHWNQQYPIAAAPMDHRFGAYFTPAIVQAQCVAL